MLNLFLSSSHNPETRCPQEGEFSSAYPGDNLYANHVLESSHRNGGQRKGEKEESTSITLAGQVATPPFPSETNDEATSSQPQWVFLCHGLLRIWLYPVLKIAYRNSKSCHCRRAVQSNSWPLHQHYLKCQPWAFFVFPGTILYWGIKKQHLKIC